MLPVRKRHDAQTRTRFTSVFVEEIVFVKASERAASSLCTRGRHSSPKKSKSVAEKYNFFNHTRDSNTDYSE